MPAALQAIPTRLATLTGKDRPDIPAGVRRWLIPDVKTAARRAEPLRPDRLWRRVQARARNRRWATTARSPKRTLGGYVQADFNTEVGGHARCAATFGVRYVKTEAERSTATPS